MSKKVLMFLMCMFLVTIGCACTSAENTTENSSSGASTKLEIKSTYLIEESGENLISIKLPTDYKFNETQNAFIADFASSKINEIGDETFKLTNSETSPEYSQNYSGYYINLESKTSYVSNDMISIIFTGLFNKKSAAHPSDILFSLNFNPSTLDIVEFSSLHIIDDTLYDEFVMQGEKQILEETDNVWPNGWDGFSKTLCSKETFFEGLNNKNSNIEWYYTENGIVFSYSVPFALGDHKEVELERSILKKDR